MKKIFLAVLMGVTLLFGMNPGLVQAQTTTEWRRFEGTSHLPAFDYPHGWHVYGEQGNDDFWISNEPTSGWYMAINDEPIIDGYDINGNYADTIIMSSAYSRETEHPGKTLFSVLLTDMEESASSGWAFNEIRTKLPNDCGVTAPNVTCGAIIARIANDNYIGSPNSYVIIEIWETPTQVLIMFTMHAKTVDTRNIQNIDASLVFDNQ